jgi:predicted transglutaminase-like cysteine proteinase
VVRKLIVGAVLASLGIVPCAAGPAVTGVNEPTAKFDQPTGSKAATPIGWTDFCNRYRGECGDDNLQPKRVSLSPETWKDLRGVNDMVNRMIEPMTDQAHWHMAEHWDFPKDGKGDCEDYALLKRKLLIERGYARQALLLTVVSRPEDEEGHAVLMVRSTKGDLILDNRRDPILYWIDTGYLFIKRQSQENQNRWVLFPSPAADPVAVSTRSSPQD